MDCVFTPFYPALFPKLWPLGEFDGISKTYFSFHTVNSRQMPSLLESQIPLPVGVLFEQLCHSNSDSNRQTIVQMDKWTWPYMNRCRSRAFIVLHLTLTCFSHSMSNLSLSVFFFLTLSCNKRGFPFQRASQTLGHTVEIAIIVDDVLKR